MKLAVALALVFAWRIAAADEASLLAGLATDDPAQLANAVTAIERAPTTPELADVLFAAGRACEDRLHDPARALTMYERIVRELPDAGISIAAERRIEQLAGVRGHAHEAAELAALVADADALPRDEVVRRGEALAAAAWPGAAEAELWLGDWSCRTTQFAAAQQRYEAVLARWPASGEAWVARRNAASCALDAHDWDQAEQHALALTVRDDADRVVRDDLLANARRGQLRAQLSIAAWIGLAVALALLLASLAEAMLRGGWRRPALRPPVEVLFLAPVAAVIVFASFTTHALIAPAVLRISLGGMALAWLSGSGLDLLRSRGRPVRTRAIAHVLACTIGVVAIGYLAVMRAELLDLLAETLKGQAH